VTYAELSAFNSSNHDIRICQVKSVWMKICKLTEALLSQQKG